MIKIDTEGAEMKILKGAERTLKENPKLKMVIAAYHYPNEAEEVAEYLKKMNFQPKIHRGVFDTVIV
jgi:histidinol phosphatase-like PHP family hydrolase